MHQERVGEQLSSAQLFFLVLRDLVRVGRRLDMPADLLTGLQINAGPLFASRNCHTLSCF